MDDESYGAVTMVRVQIPRRVPADVAAAAAAAKKTGERSALTGALKIEDEPCVVMMSATGLIARTTPSAMDVFNARSASDERLRDDQITTIFETSTRATYGLVTSSTSRTCRPLGVNGVPSTVRRFVSPSDRKSTRLNSSH